jgi:hypothetical protein
MSSEPSCDGVESELFLTASLSPSLPVALSKSFSGEGERRGGWWLTNAPIRPIAMTQTITKRIFAALIAAGKETAKSPRD